jgi:hypothetical protein
MLRAAAALLLAGVLSATPAHASGGTILLLLEPEGAERSFGARLRAELEAVGFTVLTKPLAEAAAGPASILAQARAARAAAAILVKPAHASTEIWVVDRITGKTVQREVPIPDGRDDALLVTKTTELLRASLLEVDVPGFEPAEVAPPAPVRLLLPPPPPPRGAVRLGGGAALGGSLGTTGFVRAGVAARAWHWLWTGALLSVPVTRPILEGPEGRASILLSSAEAVVEGLPWRDHRIAPTGSIVVGAAWLRATGDAEQPYTSRTVDVFSAALGARAGVSLRLVGRLRLRVEGGARALVPRPRVLFATRVAGAVTQPLPEAGGALELDAW